MRWLPACDVLVLDLDDALNRVDAVQVAHPTTAIALVGDRAERAVGSFRVLDRTWAGDRLGDELELTWIGIPARTGDDAALDKRVG